MKVRCDKYTPEKCRHPSVCTHGDYHKHNAWCKRDKCDFLNKLVKCIPKFEEFIKSEDFNV